MIPGLLLGVTALALIPPTGSTLPLRGRSELFDWALFTGPIGILALTEVASSLAYLTFASTMPLWLVDVHGVARDATLIGWTLATFSVSAALGGIVAGLVAARVGHRLLVAGTTLLAPLPLFALFQLEPGGPAYFVAAGLGGALVNAGLPLKIVTAQDLAARAVASASGMLMGFAMGIAGLLYVAIGSLQETVGLVPAASVVYAALVPAALLGFVVLSRRDVTVIPKDENSTVVALAGTQCRCTRWYADAEIPTDASVESPLHGPRRACGTPPIEPSIACTSSNTVDAVRRACPGRLGTMAAA